MLAAAPGATVIPVLPDGTADLAALAALLAEGGPALVCLMAANNETGVLHPLEAVAALYERGVIVRELPGTGLLRASVGWWNDESDLHRLVEALAAV